MRTKFLYILIFTAFFTFHWSIAQDGGEGELEDEVVDIVKNAEIILPVASRNFGKVPPQPVENKSDSLVFNVKEFVFSPPSIATRIRPLRSKNIPIPKLYGSMVRLGYGNYATPLADIYLNNKRNKQYSYGVALNHLSSGKGPVDGKNSAQSATSINAYAKAYTGNSTVYGGIGYDMDMNYFYGYQSGEPVDRDTLKQNIKRFHLNGGIKSADVDAALDYELNLGFLSLADNYKAKEADVNVEGFVAYTLDNESKIGIEYDLSFLSQKDELIDVQRSLINVAPSYTFNFSDLEIKLGVNAAVSNDTLNNLNKFHVYPDIKVSYPFSDDLLVFAGITGGIEKVTLNKLLEENPYLNKNINAFHQNKTFDFFAGLNARLSEKMAVDFGGSVSSIRNMAFYINDLERIEKFNVVYDQGKTAFTNIYAAFNFSQGNASRLGIRGDFYGYGTAEVPEAYHKPSFKLTMLGKIGLADKINLSTNLYVIGGIQALDPATLTEKTLDAAVDLNLIGEYKVSKQFAAFVSVENILNSNYQLLNQYQVKGMQVIAGFSYVF